MAENMRFRILRLIMILFAASLAFFIACGEASGDGAPREKGGVKLVESEGSPTAAVEQEEISTLERLNNVPLLELSLSSSHSNAEYDPDGVISFTLELFSPKAFAIETDTRYGGKDSDKIEMPSLTLQELGDAWPSQVELNEISGASPRAVPVIFAAETPDVDLEIGNGDVATVEVFIEPGAFEGAREVVLQARLELEKFGTIESPSLRVTLTPGIASLLEIAVAKMNFLLATGKLGEAQELGNEVVGEYPEAMRPHLLLARVYERSGQLQPALDTYKKALTLVPEAQEEPPVLIVEKIRKLIEALRDN